MITLRKKQISFFFLFIFLISFASSYNFYEDFSTYNFISSSMTLNYSDYVYQDFTCGSGENQTIITSNGIYCLKDIGSNPTGVTMNNNSGSQYLKTNSNGLDNNGKLLQITFNETFSICSGDLININVKYESTGADFFSLTFFDKNGNNVVTLRDNFESSDYGIEERKILCSSDGLTDCSNQLRDGLFGRYTSSFGTQTFDNFTTCYNDIKYMYYMHIHASGTLGDLNYINITTDDLNNPLSNELPTGNFSANTSYCYNNSAPDYLEEIPFNPILSFTDPENDDIYVKLNPTMYEDYDISENITFVADKTLYILDNINFNFFWSNHFSARNGTEQCNSWTEYAQWFAGYYDETLNWNTLCFHDDPSLFYRYSLANGYGTDWLYSLDTLTNQSALSYKFIFPSYPIKFDYVLYSNLAEKTLNYTFYQTNATNLLIYNNSILILNSTVPYNTLLYMFIDIDENSNLINTKIYNMTNGIGTEEIDKQLIEINNSLSDYTYINAFRIVTPRLTDYIKKYWALNEFDIYSEKRFTESDWISVDSVSSGTMNVWEPNLKLYVTDSVHLTTNEYNTYNYLLSVKECTDQMIMPNDYTPETDDFRPDKAIFDLLSPYLKTYLLSIGKLGLAYSVLWYMWLIIFILSVITGFYTTKEISLIAPILSASGICLILAIAIGSLTHIITFIIAIVFGLAFPFMNMFEGNN